MYVCMYVIVMSTSCWKLGLVGVQKSSCSCCCCVCMVRLSFLSSTLRYSIAPQFITSLNETVPQ